MLNLPFHPLLSFPTGPLTSHKSHTENQQNGCQYVAVFVQIPRTIVNLCNRSGSNPPGPQIDQTGIIRQPVHDITDQVYIILAHPLLLLPCPVDRKRTIAHDHHPAVSGTAQWTFRGEDRKSTRLNSSH